MSTENCEKLYEKEGKFKEFTEKIEQKFAYLEKIDTQDFIYNNYKSLIERAPIPEKESNVRDAIIDFKFKLANENFY